MEFSHSNGPTGSLLLDVDAGMLMPDQDVEQLRHSLAERGVVVLRDQVLDAQQQIDFTARFGETESFPDQSGMGNPLRGIFRVSNQGDGYNVGHYWHADRAPHARSTAISTLMAVEVPAEQPARTIFLNMHAAYLGLDKELREQLASLRWEVSTRVPLPLVRAHPETGKPLLSLPFRFPGADDGDAELLTRVQHLNSDLHPRIAGFSEADSNALMLRLLHHVLRNPAWIYEHVWRSGDLVLWDQRTTYHMATTSPYRRVLSRTAVMGRQAPAYHAAAPVTNASFFGAAPREHLRSSAVGNDGDGNATGL